MTTRFEITNQEIQTAFLNVLKSTDFSKLTINQILRQGWYQSNYFL